MPDETHNFLINHETNARRAAADEQQLTGAFQDQSRAVEELTRANERLTQAGPTPRQRLGERLEGMGADPAFRAEATRRFGDAVKAHIPEQMAMSQAIRETAATFRTLQEEIEPAVTWTEKMTSRLQDMGANQEFTTQSMERFRALVDQGVPAQTAMSQAMRETNKAIQGTGEAAQKSGHWLGNYIQRYLIRYLVVWQGMIALQSGIRNWIQAHEELDRTLFSLQTTMGMTTDQAERYINVMGGIGGAQAGMQVGAAGGMARQFGAMTGMGGAEGAQFFGGVQRQFGLDSGQLEELIPRMWAAFAKSGENIQTWLGHWEESINALEDGSDALAKWTRDWETYEATGMRASDRVSAAWAEMLSVVGNTQVITDTKNAWADFFGVLTGQVAYSDLTQSEQRAAQARYEKETGGDAARLGQFFPTGDFWDWFAKGGMEGSRPSMGGGGVGGTDVGGGATGQFIDSVRIMTQAQFTQLDAATERHEEMMRARNIESTLTTLQTATLTEQGYIFRSIDTNVLALALSNEEMNERQKTAVYNMPGSSVNLALGISALGDIGINRGNINPGVTPPDPWIPWVAGGPPYYQHGGVVPGTGPQPEIVNGGEPILPRGQSPLGGGLKISNNLFLNDRLIAVSTSRIQGDMLLQATRANQGQVGSLINL